MNFLQENYYFEHKQLGDLLVLEKLKENQDKFLHGKILLYCIKEMHTLLIKEAIERIKKQMFLNQ